MEFSQRVGVNGLTQLEGAFGRFFSVAFVFHVLIKM